MSNPRLISPFNVPRALSLVVLGVCSLLGSSVAWAHGGADYYHVRSTADSGEGSLREAIIWANDDDDTEITFQISRNDPGYDPKTGIFTIRLKHPLPRITAKGTILDGLTQTLVSNSNKNGPEIRIDGQDLPATSAALALDAGECQVKGLNFANFKGHGVVATGSNTLETRIMSNLFEDIKGAAVVLSGGASASWVGLAPKSDPVDDDFKGLYGDDMKSPEPYGNTFLRCSEGVRVSGNDTVGNAIRGNRFEEVPQPIHLRFAENAGKLISAPTGDDESAPNEGINAPTISKVSRLEKEPGVWYGITGTFVGKPKQKVTIDVYWEAGTPNRDPQSATSRKDVTVTTDENGKASWNLEVQGYPAGAMRATATSTEGSTSEMSPIYDMPWLY